MISRKIAPWFCVALLLPWLAAAQGTPPGSADQSARGEAAVGQAKPDLTGTWTMDVERSETLAQGGTSAPITFVIQQSADALVVETRRGQQSDTMTYKLAANEKAAGPMEGVPASRAYWDGARLVTETARPVQGQTVTSKEVRYLNEVGSEMTVESILEVEHGYTLRGVKTFGMARDVYKKAGT